MPIRISRGGAVEASHLQTTGSLSSVSIRHVNCRTSNGVMLTLNVLQNTADLGRVAANIMLENAAEVICCGRIPNWLLPASTSPLTTYAVLVPEIRTKGIKVRTFNIDEYLLGSSREDFRLVPADCPIGLRNIMIKAGMQNLPGGEHHFPQVAHAGNNSYERMIAQAGGIDVCLLATAPNGHLAFYEPRPDSEIGAARVATVDIYGILEITRRNNARLMSQALRRDVAIGEVPAFSISAGPGTIFGVEGLLPPPRKIVFIADRVDKADAVLQGLTGRVTAECPVSFIQEYAGNPRHQLIVLLTEEAAARFV